MAWTSPVPCEDGASTEASDSLPSLLVTVALLSGRSATVRVKSNSYVHELRRKAEDELKVPLKSMVHGRDSTVLRNSWTIAAHLSDGDLVAATVDSQRQVPRGPRHLRAFVCLREDGSLQPWGDSLTGGSLPASVSSLSSVSVRAVVGSHSAFAALVDGKVVTWGSPHAGGDSEAVQVELTDVRDVYATHSSFAAVKQDGSVVTWGAWYAGGDSTAVRDQLQDVTKIFSSSVAFAALKKDGSVVTWGMPRGGGDSRKVQAQLSEVLEIYSTDYAFAALTRSRRVVCWGDTEHGGEVPSSLEDSLVDIHHLSSNDGAFCAVTCKGRMVCWGDLPVVGQPWEELTQVVEVFACEGSVAALCADGHVVSWGACDSSKIKDQLTDVQRVFSSTLAFAALKGDGSVVAWGPWYAGGDASNVQDQLVEVGDICCSHMAFAALRRDGRVVAWGSPKHGGDASEVQEQLRDVQLLRSTEAAFAALTAEGTVKEVRDVREIC